MSKRLHQTAMDVLGDQAPAVAGRARQSGRRGLATLLALLPGLVDLRRHQRDPAHRGGRAGARPAAGLIQRSERMRDMATSSSNVVLYEVDGAVATITMNRPEVANAQDTALIDAARCSLRPGRRRRRRPGGDPGRGREALLLRPRPEGHRRRRRAGRVGPDARDPRRQVLPREDHVLRPLSAHPRLPQAHHRRRPGQLRGRRPDAGVHVRPHRGGRRRPVLQSGAAA